MNKILGQATNQTTDADATSTVDAGNPATDNNTSKEDDAFATNVAEKVLASIKEHVNPTALTPEQRLANAQVDEQIKAIERSGDFRHGLKIGAAWVGGAICAVFGVTLASAAAMRLSKSKLGVDLEPKPVIITDRGAAQMLIANTSHNA